MNNSNFILVIDQGTTGSNCAFFDLQSLRLISSCKAEHAQIYPEPGWVEHDPGEIWQRCLEGIESAWRELTQKHPGAKRSGIACIGITNQRETTLAWNRRTSELAGPAIVWQDRRTADYCEALKRDAEFDKKLHGATGLVCDPYFSATKMRWLLLNNSLAIKWLKAGELALGTIDTFLIWKMSGGEVFATEHSNASRTLLYDLRSRQYSQELCGIFEVPMESLPTIQSSIGRFGVTKGVHGLPDGIPITGCLGDQQAALYGQNCFAPGEGKITFGTGTFLLMNLGSKPVLSDKGLLTSVALSSGSEFTYCLEGSSFIAGAAIQYLRDKFGWVQSGADSDKVALSEERDPNLIFIPAFAGLAAPYWNSNARACLIGLSLKSSKAQVVRAVLESIVLQNVQLFDLVSECLKRPIKRLAVDGGVARSDFLMQLQADLLQAPLVRPGHAEATARGAALAARQGLDPSLTVPELESPVVFKPKMTTEKSRSIKEPWLKAATKVHEYYSG